MWRDKMINSFKEEEIKFLKSKNLKYKINNDDDVAYLDLYLGEILEKEEFNNEKPNG